MDRNCLHAECNRRKRLILKKLSLTFDKKEPYLLRNNRKLKAEMCLIHLDLTYFVDFPLVSEGFPQKFVP